MFKVSTITDDRIAQIEILVEEKGVITARMVSKELWIDTARANELLMRMVKGENISLGDIKVIDGVLQKTYTVFQRKPAQASMFNDTPKRDKLMLALYGNENRDSEAAWAF